MISSIYRTTAPIPSSLGMPACGHASARALAPVVERQRVKSAQVKSVQIQVVSGLGHTGDLTGGFGATPATLPTRIWGTSAWSPPSC